MSQSDFKNMTRLKRKEIRELEKRFSRFAEKPIILGSLVERAHYKGDKFQRFGFKELMVYIVEKEVIGFDIDGRICLSLKGILRYLPEKRVLTVDMGAVSFLYNGADVMAPGIVESSSDFSEGDFVWVRDEKNKRPLALGIALVDASELEVEKQGKAVRSFHHIGDFIWNALL